MNEMMRRFAATIKVATNNWNRFWFQPTDPATLCLIRIGAGAMLFYTHLVWSLDLEGFFGPTARISSEFAHVFNNPAQQGPDYAVTYFHYVTSPAALWAVHLAGLLVFLLLTIGLFTRVVSVVAFLITLAYVHRVPGALFGLDQINVFLAMYLMVGPAGACYSVDRWRSRSSGETRFGNSGQRVCQHCLATDPIAFVHSLFFRRHRQIAGSQLVGGHRNLARICQLRVSIDRYDLVGALAALDQRTDTSVRALGNQLRSAGVAPLVTPRHVGLGSSTAFGHRLLHGHDYVWSRHVDRQSGFCARAYRSRGHRSFRATPSTNTVAEVLRHRPPRKSPRADLAWSYGTTFGIEFHAVA